MVGLAPDAFVDSEYLLDDNDRAARRRIGLGEIRVEAAVAVQRWNVDHRHVGLLHLLPCGAGTRSDKPISQSACPLRFLLSPRWRRKPVPTFRHEALAP